jgi:HAD superfamily hydrolase (TIGR01509 family)
VLFDFDGLLVDTERLHYLAYQEALLKWNCPLDIDFFTYISLAHHASGSALKEFVYSLYPQISGKWEALRAEKLKIYSQLIESKVLLMPFVEEFLLVLEKMKIPSCVVTNSLKKDIEVIKKRLPPLNMIPNWITREDYQNPKPHPDGYLTALKLYPKILPNQAIGFEDTLKGIEALKASGIPSILICDPNHPQLKDAHNIQQISSFATLLI